MLSQRLSPFITLRDSPLQLVAACGIGLLLGAACVWFSPLWVFVALVGISFVAAAFRRPELILLGYLLIASTVVDPGLIPSVSIGIGTLYLTDMLLLLMFGLIILRWLVEPGFHIIRTSLDLPLLVFWLASVLSTLNAILQSSLAFRQSLGEVRAAASYLLFFVVTNLVREKRQVILLLRGLFFLATLVALAMLAQSVLGNLAIILPGRVEPLWTAGTTYGGITRVLPPGQSLILTAFITMSVILLVEEFTSTDILRLLQLGLLGLAVLLTFNRNFWISAMLVLSLLLWMARGKARLKLTGWGILVVCLAAIVVLLAAVSPESRPASLLRASAARFGSVFRISSISDSSVEFRFVEYEYAFAQVMSRPILGLGLGAKYRPFDSRIDWPGQNWDSRGYIHNGHLWVILKSGWLGYLGLASLSLIFLLRGFRYWRSIAVPQLRAALLGFTLTYLAILIASAFSPILMQEYWTPVIGIMLGSCEVIMRGSGESDSPGWLRAF